MPFLLIKRSTEAWPSVDERALECRLCPYTGPLQRREFGAFCLFHSSLGAVRAEAEGRTFVFPPDTSFEPHCAWARLRFGGDRCLIDTDPLGQVPLWRFDHPEFTAWSPEAKAFAAIPGAAARWRDSRALLASEKRDRSFSPYLNIVRELPEGLAPAYSPHAIAGNKDVAVPAGLAAAYIPRAAPGNGNAAVAALADALLASSRQFELSGEVGAFLSGGIDSSVATALLQRRRQAFPAFTLGTDLGDEYAESAELAAHLGLAHERVHLAIPEIEALWAKVIFANEVFDGMSAEILLQIAALCQAAGKQVRQVITGYGSDLLFGGMLRQAAYMAAVGVDDTAGLVERTRWSMELSPFCAWALGIRQIHLFWNPAVIEAALEIPGGNHFDGEIEKVVLRETAVQNGWLERRHAFRPKLGMTLGTSVNRLLSAHLGLDDSYGYAQKGKDALRRLQAGFETGMPA